ncbi:MAG: class I SAM-dependent methyltransferase [Spirochaetes bacterium]|nr:class I SAM-dependent methyltransferase [Spirochaetota bacterium]
MKTLGKAIEEPPPKSTDGMNIEHSVHSEFYTIFEPFFNELPACYNSRFHWLKEEIPKIERLVNFGFGVEGGETFALMWALNSKEAIGFEKDINVINKADRNRKQAIDFVEESVVYVQDHCSPQYAKDFKFWYEHKVIDEIRNKSLPIFKYGDITKGVEWESNYFDLGYSRYVLDKVDESKRMDAVTEMVRLIKPGGVIIIVAPKYAVPDDLSSLNIELINHVGQNELGKIEWEENPPDGYIYLKNS